MCLELSLILFIARVAYTTVLNFLPFDKFFLLLAGAGSCALRSSSNTISPDLP